MRKFIASIVAASAALAIASPAVAVPALSRPPASVASMLGLRLRSIELQIDVLRDRDLIGREEAQDLRAQAHRLGQRLYKATAREVSQVQVDVDRLQEQLRFAAANASLGSEASRRRDLGRFDDGERYQGESDSDYDRYDYPRPDPRGDPFAKWEERDEREPH